LSHSPGDVARRLGQIVLTVLVCVVAFEAATRVDDWVRFGVSPLSPVAAEEELLTRDSLGEHGRPGAQFQKWVLNNVGMRGPNVSVAKPPNMFRVVTAGASETFGLYESPGHEYPRQLEDTLQRVLAADDCRGARVEVLNAAIFGMSLPSVDQDLRMRVGHLHPDVVVLYPTPVQYLADEPPQATLPLAAGDGDPAPWYAVLRPRAIVALRTQLKEVLPGWLKTWLRQRDVDAMVAAQADTWRFDTIPSARLARYDRDLRHVVETVRSIGALPVIMTHANLFMTAPSRSDSSQLTAWERFYPRATGSVIVAFDSVAALITLRVARDSSVATVDLADIVRHAPSSTAAHLFGDYAHFTDMGSALVAGALGPVIEHTVRWPLGCGHDQRVVASAGHAGRAP
jgi:hypothetical protein